MTTVLGVDACPGGWVGVELRDGQFASAHVGTRLNELIGKVPDAAIIGVDMPLGLVDSGERDANRVVKRKLGNRSSSLMVPPAMSAGRSKLVNARRQPGCGWPSFPAAQHVGRRGYVCREVAQTKPRATHHAVAG
jgi:predicted RNase H-like nuclease